MGTAIGFYFRELSKEEANEVRAKLNDIAQQLGYVAQRGPTAGQGNAAAFLVAIANGEIEVHIVTDAHREAQERKEQGR